MNKSLQTHFSQELDARVARFGLRVAAGLTEHGEQLPHDVSERLRFAREQAMLKARAARAAQTEVVRGTSTVQIGDTLALGGGHNGSPRWLKLASLMPLLLLLLGLVLIQHSQFYQQVRAAAEIDTALLSDNLPPAAYGDPGFSEFLSNEQE